MNNTNFFYPFYQLISLDRRNTLVAFKDAISESGRKLSLMVSENQQRALESLLADIQGAQMSPRRKALYSLLFFLGLVAIYWLWLWFVESILSLRDGVTGLYCIVSSLSHLGLRSPGENVCSARLSDAPGQQEAGGGGDDPHQAPGTLRHLWQAGVGADPGEGGSWGKHVRIICLSLLTSENYLWRLKMTVMDRLVAELGGIETAIVALQEQVQLKVLKLWTLF